MVVPLISNGSLTTTWQPSPRQNFSASIAGAALPMASNVVPGCDWKPVMAVALLSSSTITMLALLCMALSRAGMAAW